MSLDTVLKIGKVFRESKESIKYHTYIKKCPNNILMLNLPINKDFTIDFDNSSVLVNEYELDRSFYLKFKTSDSDGLVKYIWGDIFYTLTHGDEGGFYRMADVNNKQAAYKKSSFFRGLADFNTIIKSIDNVNNHTLLLFNKSFRENIVRIENILKYNSGIEQYFLLKEEEKIGKNFPDLINDESLLIKLTAQKTYNDIISNSRTARKKLNELFKSESIIWDEIESNVEYQKKLADKTTGSIFIHFSFPENRHWYDFNDVISLLNTKMFEDFFEVQINGFVLKKSLFNTLCSGDNKGDKQFPGFMICSKYKSRLFSKEDMQDLFYGKDFSNTGKTLSKTDIKRIVLPSGDNLTANDYDEFINSRNIEEAEIIVEQRNIDSKYIDPLFSLLSNNQNESITHFDFIFSKRNTQGPDEHLIEITGVKKSTLQQISQRIDKIRNDIEEKRRLLFYGNKNLRHLSIMWSFLQILESNQKTEKKYQSHLLKVIPKIYSSNYFNDDILLIAFIEKVEHSIRIDKSVFNFLKYDLEFLLSIQNTNSENLNYMKIIESENYKMGLLLGKLAKNFAGEKSPIKSFEKNYVGNLTRRISTLKDLINFKNEVEEKLIMHEKNKFTFQTSNELAEKIKNFEGRYDKNECVFGFFEAYFAPFPKASETNNQNTNN